MSGLLLSGIVTAVVSTIALLTVHARPHPPGRVATGRRLVMALVGTWLVLAAALRDGRLTPCG